MGRWRGETGGVEIYVADGTDDGTGGESESVLLARRRAGTLEVEALGDLGEAAARNLVDCLVRGLEEGKSRFILDLGRARRVGRETRAVVQSLRRSLPCQEPGGEIEILGGSSPCWGD